MARWPDVGGWVGTDNHGGAMSGHRGLVVHIAEGTYLGTISWEKNSDSRVSSHFVTARDGRCAQMVDTANKSWCQVAGNSEWLSVENEGHSGDKLTEKQLDLVAKMFAKGHVVYGYPLQVASGPNGYGLGSHRMGGDAWGGHYSCPGSPIIAQFPEIVNRAKKIVNGTYVPSNEGGTIMFCGKGDNGGSVEALQLALNYIGANPKLVVDGDYGDKTAAAVKSLLNASTFGPQAYLNLQLALARKVSGGTPGPAGPAGKAGKDGTPGPAGPAGKPGDAAVLPAGATLRIVVE
jgi:hypothetical protein